MDYDPLTGVLHRRAFNTRLESALCTASPEQPLSLLHLDLDYFKKVNMDFGHPAGDHALHHVASLLPTEDGVVPGRGGGEEFWLLVPGLDESASFLYAGQLCKLISNQPADYLGQTIALTVRIGVSTT